METAENQKRACDDEDDDCDDAKNDDDDTVEKEDDGDGDDDDDLNAALESMSFSLGRITQFNLSIRTPNTSVPRTCVQMLSVSLFQAKADLKHFR